VNKKVNEHIVNIYFTLMITPTPPMGGIICLPRSACREVSPRRLRTRTPRRARARRGGYGFGQESQFKRKAVHKVGAPVLGVYGERPPIPGHPRREAQIRYARAADGELRRALEREYDLIDTALIRGLNVKGQYSHAPALSIIVDGAGK